MEHQQRTRGRISLRNVIKKIVFGFCILVILPITLMAGWSVAMGWPDNWSTADWSSAGIAPNPVHEKEAIIQVYAARAGRWKGVFSVHSWIVYKPEGSKNFTRYDVVGWGRPLRRNKYPPDGRWYGNKPEIVLDIRGQRATGLIAKIDTVVRRYPFQSHGYYRAWPGPNSNTFVAWVGRQIPELGLEMPSNAIGKDFIGAGPQLSPMPSGTGWQISLWGFFGIGIAIKEGVELHILGSTLGIDFDDLSIELPGIGDIGFSSDVEPVHG